MADELFDMTEPRVMWHTRIAGDPASERPTTTTTPSSDRALM